MGLLNNVVKGKVKKPHLVLIYGVPGVGKSSFGASAPDPIFLGMEEGTNNLDVTRFPALKSWDDVVGAIKELHDEKHAYKTLVIDSLDWLEPILHQMICDRHGAKSIELAAGGYGKGYVEAVSEWVKFCRMLTTLRDARGMNIVLIGHSEIVKFSDPFVQAEYDRYQLKLYKKSAAIFREYVDSLLFANFETFHKKEGGKSRAFGEDGRFLYTERRPGWDAKNRFGLQFQISLDSGWKDYEAAVDSANCADPVKVKDEIVRLIKELKDREVAAKASDALEKAGNDYVRLDGIRNRLLTVMGEK